MITNRISRKVTKFFVLVYLLSVPWWIVGFLFPNLSLPLSIPASDIFAVLSPVIAAFILLVSNSGINGVKVWIKNIFNLKGLNLKILIIATAIPLIIFGFIYLALLGIGVSSDSLKLAEISFWTLVGVSIFFFLGSLLEEAGYTAFLMSDVDKRADWVVSIMIGTLWSLWHIPSMLMQGRGMEFILWGVLGTVAFRIIYIWFYRYSGGVVMSVVLMHTVYNIGRMLFMSESFAPLVEYPVLHFGIIIVVSIPFAVILLSRSRSK